MQRIIFLFGVLIVMSGYLTATAAIGSEELLLNRPAAANNIPDTPDILYTDPDGGNQKLILTNATAGSAFNVLGEANQKPPAGNFNPDPIHSHVVLEPWTYSSDFSDRTLGAWAAYPLWQDTAYDPNFRTNEMVPGDSNVSIVQKVTPFANVDNYAGAQKLLDMYLVPESTVRFRYYLKTHLDAEFIKVRFAAGEYGKLDVTLPAPETNGWVMQEVDFNDFVRENPELAGKDRIKIYALAFLAKFPEADPDLPIYLGLDDIVFRGARATAFRFAEPAVYKLPEFAPYIPKKHYYPGDEFRLSGNWPVDAQRVEIEIALFTDEHQIVYEGALNRNGDRWVLDPLNLNFPAGLYRGRLAAYDGSGRLSETEFTIHIAPQDIAGRHPRLRMNEERIAWMQERFRQERFQGVYEEILENAKVQRERVPVENLVYDLDQFPDEDWLPSWSAWGSRIYHTGEAVKWNSRAYAFHGDREAGEYVRDVLLAQASWPDWTHPWQTRRGRFSEHRTGRWSHPVAEAYDLVYDLMTPDERRKIERAFMDHIIRSAHRTYVYNDNITPKTSNWIAHVIGGSLMTMAAIFGDSPQTENMEPYFTGAMLKFYEFLEKSTDTEYGAYGEGLGYYSSSISNLVEAVPSLKNAFNIDVSDPLANTYKEYIWGGFLEENRWFEFGQSGSMISTARRSDWAFLLEMHDDPLLNWWYNHLKERETFEDVLFETRDVSLESSYDKNPVRQFRGIGTTVFRDGWQDEDFIFTMRTGPFYNHQHHDQGAMWLADRGEIFIIGSRSIGDSGRYDDPLFESVHIQPVSKSTILIDDNPQSQRIGDHLNFAPGFHDHAFIDHFLDGQDAAFSTGDIGRIYWDVESLSRNALFIKPGVLLMLDTTQPGHTDRDVTLLYHTEHLADIEAGNNASRITRGDATLHINHLAPAYVDVKAVETPHFLRKLQREHPLERSGKLTVTASTSHTHGYPLVMANLFTTTDTDASPDVTTRRGEGYMSGVVSGRNFAFSTKPGRMYSIDNMFTDALAMTWCEDRTFVAKATEFRRGGEPVVVSDEPVTFELSGDGLKYYRSNAGTLEIAVPSQPSSVMLNGETARDLRYDSNRRLIVIEVPAGEGAIVIQD